MMKKFVTTGLSTLALLGCLSVSETAIAGGNDISLVGLGRPVQSSLDDPAVKRFRRLSSELAITLSPNLSETGRTRGMSGFGFGLITSYTNINEAGKYWQGQPGTPVLAGPLEDKSVPSYFFTPTLYASKGLPFSSQIGASLSLLSGSQMSVLNGNFKFALHESYFRKLPTLSAQFAINRLLGATDIDLISGSLDLIASYAFGLSGMTRWDIFVGGGQQFAHVNSLVLDETPFSVDDATNDQRGGTNGSLYTFPTLEWKDNVILRIMGGLKVHVAMFEIVYGFRLSQIKWSGRSIPTHSLKFGFDL